MISQACQSSGHPKRPSPDCCLLAVIHLPQWRPRLELSVDRKKADPVPKLIRWTRGGPDRLRQTDNVPAMTVRALDTGVIPRVLEIQAVCPEAASRSEADYRRLEGWECSSW